MAFFKGRRETSSQSRPGVAEELGDMGAGLYLLTPSSGFAIAMPTGTLMVIGGVPAVGLKVYYRYHSVDKSYMFWTLSTLQFFGDLFFNIYICSHHSIRRAVLFYFHFSIFYFPSSITVPLLCLFASFAGGGSAFRPISRNILLPPFTHGANASNVMSVPASSPRRERWDGTDGTFARCPKFWITIVLNADGISLVPGG